jgi:hypothetical protein
MTGPEGVIAPELSNYVEQVLALESLQAGNWVNLFVLNGERRARLASAQDTSKPAHGYVTRDTVVGGSVLVYFTGPNRFISTTLFSLTPDDIGQPVYLSVSVPGGIQKTLPSGTNQGRQFLGFVTQVTAGGSVVISKITDQAGAIPGQNGNAGRFLTTDGNNLSWGLVPVVPSPAGNDGKILSTDGSQLFWIALGGQIPATATHDGKFLTTDGSTTSWGTPAGFSNPMTAVGDLLVGGALGAPARLARGNSNQVLRTKPDGTLGWIDQFLGSGSAVLVSGNCTVSFPALVDEAKILLTISVPGLLANIGTPYVAARTSGTEFTITSTNALDTSTIDWLIVVP